MDIEKLIERLEAWNEQHLSVVCGGGHFACDYLCENEDCIVVRAATALSTLQAENKRLNKIVCSIPTTPDSGRTVSQYDKEMSMCAYLDDLEAENEKLRAELEQVKEDWSTAVNGLMLMQKKLNKVYRMLYDPLIIVDGGHLRPVKNTSRQQVYKKLVDLQVEMGINRGFPWGEMRMEKKED